MNRFSYRVYIDESGDEGFVFKPDQQGSSRWLILSAVIVRKQRDVGIVELMREIRQMLGRERKHPIHFLKLDHAQSVAVSRHLGGASDLFRTVSVLIHKPSIEEPEKFQAQKHQLYRYASRLLLERVSWFCRDHVIPDQGDGSAEIIYSNRDQMSYDDLRDYLKRLRLEQDRLKVSVHWPVIDPDHVRAVQANQMAGLQVADAIAHCLFKAVSPNRFGDVEERYARHLWPTFYRHPKAGFLGYGVKFWPHDFPKLQTANPHLALFAG